MVQGRIAKRLENLFAFPYTCYSFQAVSFRNGIPGKFGKALLPIMNKTAPVL